MGMQQDITETVTNDVHQFWNAWLAKNQQRFSHPPIVSKMNNDSLSFKFVGVNRVLTGLLEFDGRIGIYIDNTEGKYWDCIAEFYLKEQQSEDGRFFCGYCDATDITLYPTRKILWESHVFDLLLDWCNAKFQPNCVIVLWGSYEDGWWGARLLGKEQVVQYGYAETKCLDLLVSHE